MTIRIDVRIEGLDRLQQKYSRRQITGAARSGMGAALFQMEAEAKDSATRIIYSRPERTADGGSFRSNIAELRSQTRGRAAKKAVTAAGRRGLAIAGRSGKRTGAYRASLTRGGGGNVRRLAGDHAAFGSKLNYAKIIETGSKPHVIRPRTKKALAFWGGGDVVVRRSVKHPGTKPRHVLRWAARNGRGRITGAFARQFWRTLGVA